MAYIGKYQHSRKAVDIELLPEFPSVVVVHPQFIPTRINYPMQQAGSAVGGAGAGGGTGTGFYSNNNM